MSSTPSLLARNPASNAGKPGSVLQQLMDKAELDDPLLTPMQELAELQLEAAREVFAKHRKHIHVLKRRAEDTGINEIRSLKDIVPLLFSHTTYKSYPASFITKGQWDRLLKWFGTLSALPVDNVDIEGVKDIDDFIDRLWAAGHKTITSSGTSGKVSLLNRIDADYEVYQLWINKHFSWPKPMPPQRNLPYFQMTPKYGPYIIMATSPRLIKMFGRPDSVHYLSEDRLRIAYLMRAGEMRQKIGDGSATPQEITDYEAQVKAQQTKAMAEFEKISDKVIEVLEKHEPMHLTAQWGMLWRIIEKARACGLPDGAFHPNSIISTGGGTKGLTLPPDYQEQARKFIGNIHHFLNVYGMCEMSVCYPGCEHGRYHVIPWIIPLLLDAKGENLVEHNGGVVEGRFAFLDLSYQARWGGLISGDKVRMDFSEKCTCGRPGPVVLPEGISRYAAPGEEDKIGCAGTIEAYIRGAIE